MKHKVSGVAALVLVLLAGALAHAETRPVEARGEVAVTTRDARVRAIDAALAEAVSRTLAQVVPASARQRHGRELNAEVVRRARRYVASFQVLEEAEIEGQLRLRVAAHVDMDRIRNKLAALGIDLAAAAPAPIARSRPRVVLLLHATLGSDTAVTFGERGDDGGAAGRAVARQLREHGFEIVPAARVAPPVSREALEGAPLSDAAAAELAREAGAGGAFVIGVHAEPDGYIRGTQLVGARARATLRVLDVHGAGQPGRAQPGAAPEVLARAQVAAAGFAGSVEDALAAAAGELGRNLLLAVAGTLAEAWPPALAADDVLLVEVIGYRGWQGVRALINHLARVQGVARVWPRHVGRRGVVLAVATELDRRRVASAIGRAELPGSRASVASWGERGLRVTLVGAEGGLP